MEKRSISEAVIEHTRDQFWSLVAKPAEAADRDGCWEWRGNKTTSKYGVTHLNCGFGSFVCMAHRYAYITEVGPIPEGLQVLHRCDNRRCVRPSHLFLGTNLDNIKDRVAKGRSWRPVGEKNQHAKLTATDVLEIRKRFAAGGVTKTQLANEHKVSFMTIHAILSRVTWKHV